MKPAVKKTIIYTGIALVVGGLAWSYWQYTKARRIFDGMLISIRNIRNFGTTGNWLNVMNGGLKLKLDFDLLITNTTTESVSLSVWFTKLTSVNFFYNNQLIATIPVVVEEVNIPASNQVIFSNIHAEIPINTLLNIAPEIVDLNNMELNFDYNKLTITANIQFAGQNFLIG